MKLKKNAQQYEDTQKIIVINVAYDFYSVYIPYTFVDMYSRTRERVQGACFTRVYSSDESAQT